MPVRLILAAFFSVAAFVRAQSADGAAAAGLAPCQTDEDCIATPRFAPNCAANGFCGDNGALCSSSTECYDYCSVEDGTTTGVCGGGGALCNTNDSNDYDGFRCFAGFTCGGDYDLNGDPTGVCELNAPVPSTRGGPAGPGGRGRARRRY